MAQRLIRCDGPHPSDEAIQRPSDLLELQHTTPLALNMLAQSAQRVEPLPTPLQRAHI